MAVFDSNEFSRTLLAGLQMMQQAFEHSNQLALARQRMDQEAADNKRLFAMREEGLRLQEQNLQLKQQIETRRASTEKTKLAGEAFSFDKIETADQWKDGVRIRDQRLEDVATQATLDPSDPEIPRDINGQSRLDQKFAGMGLKEINRYEENINARLAQYGDIAAQMRNPEAKALREKYQLEGPALQAQRDYINKKIVSDPILQDMNKKLNGAQKRFIGQSSAAVGEPAPRVGQAPAPSNVGGAVAPASTVIGGPAGTPKYADILSGVDVLAAYDENDPVFKQAVDQVADRLAASILHLPKDDGNELQQEFDRRMLEKGAGVKAAIVSQKVEEKLRARK